MKTKHETQKSFDLFRKTTNVLLVDNMIDLLINKQLLENNGVSHVHCLRKSYDALIYLEETKIKYHLILVEIYLPVVSGYDFIKQFRKLNLDKKHGDILLISASLNPLDKKKSIEYNVRFIEKPLLISDLQKLTT